MLAFLAHGSGGHIDAYLEQTQRESNRKRLPAVVGKLPAPANQIHGNEKREKSMSQEKKTIFRMIREKAITKVAVALLATTLLAGAGLDLPPGPSAPAALDYPPGPTGQITSLDYPPGPGAPTAA